MKSYTLGVALPVTHAHLYAEACDHVAAVLSGNGRIRRPVYVHTDADADEGCRESRYVDTVGRAAVAAFVAAHDAE